MNKNLWSGAIVLAVVVIVGVFAFRHHSTSAKTVTLGVIAGTTGDYAAAGQGYVNGFKLAMEDWNKNHSQQFSAVIEDDGFNAQKGVTAYQKLKSINQPAAYAIVSSFTIDAIANDLHKEGKPVALGFEQSVPATADNIFQVLPAARPIQQGLGAHLKELGYKKPLVILSNNTPVYGNFYAGFVDGYGNGVTKETINSDPTTIRAVAVRAKADAPDVIVIYADPPSGALMAKQIIQTFGSTVPHLAFDQSIESGITDYKKVFGNTLSQLNNSIVAVSKNDFTSDFTKAYKAKYATEPPFGSDMGYNAFMLLARTYAGSSSTWIQNMKSAHFTGADGDVSFDNVGLRVPNTYFATMQSGAAK